jgi:hypothetical protein
MGGALHPGVARAGASFELDRLEIVDDRLVVRGWWFGVRGMRFVRPALIVDDRQILATLEHKPWACADDGGWIAAFPWKRGVDVAGVALVVAPSVEVPLDRDADAPPRVLREVRVVPAAPRTVVEKVHEPLRDELDRIERELDAVHAELRDARAQAAEREARCRELEQVVARERRATSDSEVANDEIVRAHAMAVLDRDRALAQHAEAVNDREAAVRARKRMERQSDEALAAGEAAEARRDEALAQRDEARMQRDELLLAHQSLQAQLKGSLADAERTERLEVAPAPGQPAAPGAPPAPDQRDDSRPEAGRLRRLARDRRLAAAATIRPTAPDGAADPDAPIGVRTIPAARAVAGSLHRSQRERTSGVTRYDMWAIRILGSVAALAFISLLGMILKAFFVF